MVEAFYSENSKYTIRGGTFSENQADYGAGIYNKIVP